ncbi:Proline-rich transmembrane protein 3 [Collichthys lucidus]|uniref:Proline-rich transmembrane protein 3 n=1 Tax=Collichthys lucidus TaxID=240159 RepID=A0A4U5UBD9_COLLU|nr:Proline-rich transmembrane protein 3 [Collichthys lucidus]
MGSSLLLITLLASLGSLLQTSGSLDSDSLRMTQRTGRNNNAPDSLSTEVRLKTEAFLSVEGGRQDVSSTASQRLLNQTAVPKEPERAGNEKQSGSGITLTTTPALSLHHSGPRDPKGADKANTSITGYTHSSVHIISESHITAEERPSHTSTVNDDFLNGLNSRKLPIQNNVHTSTINQNMSGPGGSRVLGLRPCVVLPNFNGTNLLWEDMRRTLAFAWELHVFGSAGLFILMAVLAVIGMAGACALPHSVCDALILTDCLLILSGALRGVLLLLDPYGTCQILSRAALAAFQNVPLHLLLWAQVAVTLVTLRGLNILLFPLRLQHKWVVGALAISHCTLLFIADLFSPPLSPALPLLLQTLSLCWGLPFCMGILSKTCSNLHPFVRSSFPQWFPSQRIEKRAKQVTAVCAFLGVLCCSLHMYSLLWLYGLLGNWRRFGWGWWLTQFWARILELAWGFSLLVLGSWISWMPSLGNLAGDQGESRSDAHKEAEEASLWGSTLSSIRKEKTWEDLMPSNWAKYNLCKTGFIKNVMRLCDDLPPTIIPECMPDTVSITNSDAQGAILWQKVGERECVLSLIEFDLRPPSPINLRRSIDNALYQGQLAEGGLFPPAPPSWTHPEGTNTIVKDSGTATSLPDPVGYKWTLDADSISASLDHRKEKQSPTATSDYNSNNESSAVMHQQDWYIDDLCNVDSEVAVQSPSSSAGSVHFSSVESDVEPESVASARRGSLVFRFDGQRHQNSTPVFHNLMHAKLKRLDPSVQCSDNLMTLKVRGVRAPHFLVDRGEGHLIPLSQMPPKCGFSVKRSRRDVRFAAPYQGCNVTQQGGDYVLPLRLWGAPMTLSCPAVLPPPTVSCFPSGMVLKISGVTANELHVKVSGTWKSLSMVCSSCGIAVEVLPGGLTLTAPYNRGLCIETKGEEYLLTLLLADVGLLVTCPSLLDTKPTTTTTPPRDSGQSQQYAQYPQFPMFPQPPALTPPPLLPMGTVAPLPQGPQLPSGSNPEAPPAKHDAFPFMAQYPQFLQYPLFPKPVPPTQPATANENTAAPLAQLPQMPQSLGYPFSFFPQFPMAPGIFHPTTPPPPPPATSTEALVTTPATGIKHDGKPCVHQQSPLLMPPQYPLLPDPEPSLPPQGQSQPVVQEPKPYYVYPQTYQIPVLYPPPKYPSQRQNTQTAAPITTSPTSAANTLKPAAQKPFYYPHPYMPAYYVPPHTPMPVFPDPPGTPPANSAPSDEQEHQPIYAMPPFYYYPSYQRPNRVGRHS